MKRIKIIYALVFATAFMLLIAFSGATFAEPDSQWYLSLSLPSFAASGTLISIAWAIVYCIFIILIARLVMVNDFSASLILIIIINVLSAVWVPVFFRAESLIGGLIIETILVILCFILLYKLLKDERYTSSILFAPVLIWYCYTFIVSYTTYMLN